MEQSDDKIKDLVAIEQIFEKQEHGVPTPQTQALNTGEGKLGILEKIERFLRARFMMMVSIYVLTMVIAGSALVLNKNTEVFASGTGGGDTGPLTFAGAALWAVIAVASFLFILANIWLIVRKGRRRTL